MFHLLTKIVHCNIFASNETILWRFGRQLTLICTMFVLLARQSLLEARLSLLENRYALLVSHIQLYKSLGG